MRELPVDQGGEAAMLEQELSEEEAAELLRRWENPAAVPRIPPRQLPMADPAIFRRRSEQPQNAAGPRGRSRGSRRESMVSTLQRYPFSESLLLVGPEFDSGDEPREREAADWIRAPLGVDGALELLKGGDQVWLCGTPEDGLVGFGSLTNTRWRWRTAKSKAAPLLLIPMLAIQRRFWGKPTGEASGKFSNQLLGDLIFEAGRRQGGQALLGRYVHESNARAIRLCEKVGFIQFHKTFIDPLTGARNVSMLLDRTTAPAS